MDENTIQYIRRREQDERAAAKIASSQVARRAHLELAQAYADLLRGR